MSIPLSVLLKDKGYVIHQISATAYVHESALKMQAHNIGALLVMDGEKIRGIISERDIIYKLVAHQKNAMNLPVSDVMTKNIRTVPSTMTVHEAMRIVTDQRIRHLPVVDNNKLVGMISIGDLTRWVMLQQADEIDALTGYIQGEIK